MGKGDTLLNAVIGAAVTVALSFTGFSPLLGGGVAGYLQQRGRRDGGKVGALSGAIAFLPSLLFVLLFFGVFFLGGGFPGGVELLLLLFVLFPILLIWNVALGGVGGYLGAYAREEFGSGRRRERAAGVQTTLSGSERPSGTARTGTGRPSATERPGTEDRTETGTGSTTASETDVESRGDRTGGNADEHGRTGSDRTGENRYEYEGVDDGADEDDESDESDDETGWRRY